MALSTTSPNRALQIWLYATAFMVFAMAIIGAITRLTESGLSIVEWKPLMGAIPPLSEAKWLEEFDLYRQTPEYIHKNAGMSLDEFKNIYFWEWFHRLWGRLIGLVYGLPLIWFWVKGQIPKGYKLKLFGLLILGGLQGVLGWYMVMSGLVDRPDVSQFRLAAHLSLALFIFSLLIWLALSLGPPVPRVEPVKSFWRQTGWGVLALVAVTIVWGAFTAGLDGGKLYNTWPMMNAYWIPPEVTGFYSILHDPAAVQFVHRWLAIVTLFAVLFFAWGTCDYAIMGAVILQVFLGIATVLSITWIPLAAAHQAGAIVLLGLLIRRLYALREIRAHAAP